MRISISDLPTPVFEPEPGAPPVALPIPIAHTVLRNELSTPLAHEELRRPNQKTKSNTVAKHPALFFRSPSPCSVASSSEISDAETDSEMESLVKKPDGEAGRPGRGGYNLEDAVCLATKDYNHLKVCKYDSSNNITYTHLGYCSHTCKQSFKHHALVFQAEDG